MIAIPGDTSAATISGIITVEMKQQDTMTEPRPCRHFIYNYIKSLKIIFYCLK